MLRKPQGSIKLDEQSRVVHTKGEMAFQVKYNVTSIIDPVCFTNGLKGNLR